MKVLLKIILFSFYFFGVGLFCQGQLQWQNADADYGPLPPSMHVFKSVTDIDGKKNIAFYVIADLKSKDLSFTTDTTLHRRLTPTQFYENENRPLVVVNATFFSFATNQNLNLVIKDGKQLGYNVHTIAGRKNDTLLYHHPFHGALGISKKGMADVAWIYSDSSKRYPYASQQPLKAWKDSSIKISKQQIRPVNESEQNHSSLKKWKMKTAVGGGPVLLQDGNIKISNNEEMKFSGKAINDRHPRTAIGYTSDNRLVILVIQGRTPGIAEGATLLQEAQILKDLGCTEALNLDGGGSSCMLVNGKETITPSDKSGQRAVPAVFIVEKK
ncbi:MAG TPA: phosphodiester glycosidase family protein [Chitinophagaceae bacterium]